MIEILLIIIVIELFVIILQGNRLGEWAGRSANSALYKWRTRKVKK